MPSKFTISQLGSRGSVDIIDTDLALLTIGTATYDLSSVRITTKEFGDYLTTKYAENNTFSVHGPLSAAEGFTAVYAASTPINLADLPSSPAGLVTGDLYTQEVKDVIGSGVSTDKVLMVK